MPDRSVFMKNDYLPDVFYMRNYIFFTRIFCMSLYPVPICHNINHIKQCFSHRTNHKNLSQALRLYRQHEGITSMVVTQMQIELLYCRADTILR